MQGEDKDLALHCPEEGRVIQVRLPKSGRAARDVQADRLETLGFVAQVRLKVGLGGGHRRSALHHSCSCPSMWISRVPPRSETHMSSQGWPCADVACRSNWTGMRYMTANMSSRHDAHHILETMMKSSTYRANATCSSSLQPPGKKPCRARVAESSVQAASSAPRTTLQLAGL